MLTVRPGDKVRWAWNLAVPQEGTGIAVHSTANPASNTWDGKGFNTQEKTSKGNLLYQFMTEGSFSYNTQDVIEGESVFMPGKVVVAAPAEDEVVTITATIGSITAEAVGGASVSSPSPACTEADDSCAAPSSTELEFTFATCLTPAVTDIQLVSGAAPGNTRYADIFFQKRIEIICLF